MNKKVILFLNGESPIQFPELSLYDKIFCTDGSYSYLKEHHIIPDYITGDFDSIDLNEISSKTIKISTPDQNFTDFEKALKIIQDLGYLQVDVYGGSGKQQDHFIGNLNAAFKFKNFLKIKFFDNFSTYFFVDSPIKINKVLNKTISLIPFPTTENIVTKGLEYPLFKEDLNILNRIGTRNRAIENEIEIKFESGHLVVFIINE